MSKYGTKFNIGDTVCGVEKRKKLIKREGKFETNEIIYLIRIWVIDNINIRLVRGEEPEIYYSCTDQYEGHTYHSGYEGELFRTTVEAEEYIKKQLEEE